MPTNNAINLFDQGVPYYDGAGTFSAPILTLRAPIIADASNAIKSTAAMTNGQVLIGSTGADPVPATISVGAGLSSVSGAGTFTISATGGGLSWQSITLNQTLVVNNGYFVTSGTLSLALPTTAVQGSIIWVTLNGGTSFTITQGVGQQIRIGSNTTTSGVGGSLASTAQGDCVQLVCSTTNTGWLVLSSFGNITYV